MMPAQKAWDLREILDLIRQYDFNGQRRVSFEYTIFHGWNDTPAHAEELRLKIEEKGYRTRIQKQGRRIVVLVLARGPEEKGAEVRSAMLRLRLGEPLERGRKPVFRPASLQ